jgi:hypothetical protein
VNLQIQLETQLVMLSQLQTQLKSSPGSSSIQIQITQVNLKITQLKQAITLRQNALTYLKIIINIQIELIAMIPVHSETEEAELEAEEAEESEESAATALNVQIQIAILIQIQLNMHLQAVLVLKQLPSTIGSESEEEVPESETETETPVTTEVFSEILLIVSLRIRLQTQLAKIGRLQIISKSSVTTTPAVLITLLAAPKQTEMVSSSIEIILIEIQKQIAQSSPVTLSAQTYSSYLTFFIQLRLQLETKTIQLTQLKATSSPSKVVIIQLQNQITALQAQVSHHLQIIIYLKYIL